MDHPTLRDETTHEAGQKERRQKMKMKIRGFEREGRENHVAGMRDNRKEFAKEGEMKWEMGREEVEAVSYEKRKSRFARCLLVDCDGQARKERSVTSPPPQGRKRAGKVRSSSLAFFLLF